MYDKPMLKLNTKNAVAVTREGGEIIDTRIDNRGTGFVMVVTFKDGSYYEENCTATKRNMRYTRYWVDEEVIPFIVERAKYAHNEYIETAEYGQLVSAGTPTDKNVEYAMKKNKAERSQLPLGLNQARRVIFSIAQLIGYQDLEQSNKRIYADLLNIYLTVHTQLCVARFQDQLIIQELLKSFKKYIKEYHVAEWVLDFSKNVIMNPEYTLVNI